MGISKFSVFIYFIFQDFSVAFNAAPIKFGDFFRICKKLLSGFMWKARFNDSDSFEANFVHTYGAIVLYSFISFMYKNIFFLFCVFLENE
jgi:hypothetical protein